MNKAKFKGVLYFQNDANGGFDIVSFKKWGAITSWNKIFFLIILPNRLNVNYDLKVRAFILDLNQISSYWLH